MLILLLLALATISVHCGPTRAASCSPTLEQRKLALFDNYNGKAVKNFTTVFVTGLKTHVSSEEMGMVTKQIIDAVDAAGEKLVTDFRATYRRQLSYEEIKISTCNALLYHPTITNQIPVWPRTRKQLDQVFLICGKHVVALWNGFADDV